jgi:heme exporter protein D
MQWHSVSEFFAMGGYAVYVWGSVGACALAIALEWWWIGRRHRRIVAALRRGALRAPGRPAAPTAPRTQERTA